MGRIANGVKEENHDPLLNWWGGVFLHRASPLSAPDRSKSAKSWWSLRRIVVAVFSTSLWKETLLSNWPWCIQRGLGWDWWKGQASSNKRILILKRQINDWCRLRNIAKLKNEKNEKWTSHFKKCMLFRWVTLNWLWTRVDGLKISGHFARVFTRENQKRHDFHQDDISKFETFFYTIIFLIRPRTLLFRFEKSFDYFSTLQDY